MSEAAPSFKERHRNFQHIAKELTHLRSHNLAVLEGRVDGAVHLYSFLAVTFVALERFLRMVLGPRAVPGATLQSLLEQVSGSTGGLIAIEDRKRVIQLLNETRIGVMHGKLGTDAEGEGLLGYFLPYAFDLYELVNDLVAAFDATTGARREGGSVGFVARRLDAPSGAAVLTPHGDLEWLRAHNLNAAEAHRHDRLLLIAEGALAVVLLEAASRRALELPFEDEADFGECLRRAILGSPRRLRIPTQSQRGKAQKRAVQRVIGIRNSLAHANYEQAAAFAGCASVDEYFRLRYAGEIEALFGVYSSFREQLGARDEALAPVAHDVPGERS